MDCLLRHSTLFLFFLLLCLEILYIILYTFGLLTFRAANLQRLSIASQHSPHMRYLVHNIYKHTSYVRQRQSDMPLIDSLSSASMSSKIYLGICESGTYFLALFPYQKIKQFTFNGSRQKIQNARPTGNKWKTPEPENHEVPVSYPTLPNTAFDQLVSFFFFVVGHSLATSFACWSVRYPCPMRLSLPVTACHFFSVSKTLAKPYWEPTCHLTLAFLQIFHCTYAHAKLFVSSFQ